MTRQRVYLGDSVYADFDGMHIILTIDNGYTFGPPQRICLDVATYQALVEFAHAVGHAPPPEDDDAAPT